RQEAQFELVARGEAGWQTLGQIAGSKGDTLPRIHAIWGLGQAKRNARGGSGVGLWGLLGPLLGDPNAEVRAQSAKVLGEAREPSALLGLIALLGDASPRVRFFAALSLGKLGQSKAIEPLLAMVAHNADADPYLRHAGVLGLVGAGNPAAWKSAAHSRSPAVRMA